MNINLQLYFLLKMPRERKTRTSTEVLHYLITLSETNRADELPNEWNFVIYKKRIIKDNHCLCRQLIKHQYYYYNWKTKKAICLGGTCQYTYGFKERREQLRYNYGTYYRYPTQKQ